MAKFGDFLLRPFSLVRKSVGLTVGVSIGCALLSLSVLLYFWHFPVGLSLITTKHDLEDIGNEPFTVSSKNIIFEIHGGAQITLKLKRPVKTEATVKIMLDDPAIIETVSAFQLSQNHDKPIYIPINSRDVAGHCIMSFQSESKELSGLYKTRIKVKVVHHILFGYLSIALGWCYLLCWGVSHYPQIYRNYARKSTVGFSYDFLALTITGHLGYCAFNVSMYFNSYIQKSYFDLSPKGDLPVKIHDVLLTVHAQIMNGVYILQILMYERGGQRVSLSMATFVGGMWVSIIAGLNGCIWGQFSWLQYLYFLCYLKLATTPIKYSPQLYLHCVRKSTEGWSIISVFLDISGSCLCLLQMFCDAVNNDDWASTVGNPGKLGLAAITFTYDIMFIIQHFFLYRNPIKQGKFAHASREQLVPLKVLYEQLTY